MRKGLFSFYGTPMDTSTAGVIRTSFWGYLKHLAQWCVHARLHLKVRFHRKGQTNQDICSTHWYHHHAKQENQIWNTLILAYLSLSLSIGLESKVLRSILSCGMEQIDFYAELCLMAYMGILYRERIMSNFIKQKWLCSSLAVYISSSLQRLEWILKKAN